MEHVFDHLLRILDVIGRGSEVQKRLCIVYEGGIIRYLDAADGEGDEIVVRRILGSGLDGNDIVGLAADDGGLVIARESVVGGDIEIEVDIDVKADVLAPFSEADGVLTYAGAISKIHRKNLDRDFVARGYIYYIDFNGVGHYIYSDTTCTRNVDYVATKALENPDETFGAKTEEDLWFARAIAEKLTVKYWNDILSDPFGKDPF
jgi:hypothetical protein